MRLVKTGKVRSYQNNRHGIGTKARILKPILNHNGYETVCLGKGHRKLVHRLVADAFIPNPNNLPLVRHLDDNPKNNIVENLAWGTQKDNMQDCVKHGRLVGDTSAAIESRKKKVYAWKKNEPESTAVLYNSYSDAARELSVWSSHIPRVIKGEISQTGGYKFKPEKEENDGTHQ